MRWFSALLVTVALCLACHHGDAQAAGSCDECASSSDCDACGATAGCDDAGCCDTVRCDADCCDAGCSDTVRCDAGCCDACCCDAGCGERDRLLSSCSLLKGDPCACDYFTLFGGWIGLHDYTGEEELPIPPPTPVVRSGSFNDGWGIGGALGRRFSESCRGELEFAFRSNTADDWFVNGNPVGPWSGHFFSYALMGNLYRDLQSCSALGWTPYIGGGIGVAFLDGKFRTGALDLTIDDTEFAYQMMVGGSRQIRPGVEALVEYRFFGTTDFDLINNTPTPSVAFGGDAYEADGLSFGLRWYH